MAVLDNDASGCHGRAAVALMAAAALHLGAPWLATRAQAMALVLMLCFVKAMCGILGSLCWPSRSRCLLGAGQGSGGSPSIWLSIVAAMPQTLMKQPPMAMPFADPWGDTAGE